MCVTCTPPTYIIICTHTHDHTHDHTHTHSHTHTPHTHTHTPHTHTHSLTHTHTQEEPTTNTISTQTDPPQRGVGDNWSLEEEIDKWQVSAMPEEKHYFSMDVSVAIENIDMYHLRVYMENHVHSSLAINRHKKKSRHGEQT